MIKQSIILYKETKKANSNLLVNLNQEIKQFFARGHKLNTIYTGLDNVNKNIRINRHIYTLADLTTKNGKLQFIEAETLEHPKEFLKLSIQELEENYV
jgi:hypothetical protein